MIYFQTTVKRSVKKNNNTVFHKAGLIIIIFNIAASDTFWYNVMDENSLIKLKCPNKPKYHE